MENREDIKSYYRFHDEEKEVEFLRHDMPTPWMNYLSNGTLHTMMSHAGGGVAFYKTPQIFRINHYRFFHLPADRSGFYTYIKDGSEVWCPTYQPVPVKPDTWKSYHGMGYTRFEAKKREVSVKANYFIGKYANAMIWNLKIKSSINKEVVVYPFVELGMMEFMRELQWQCYNKHQLSVKCLEDEVLVYKYGVENQPKPEETPLVYFAANQRVTGYEGDRDEFIGAYRSEEDPIGVINDKLTNSLLQGGDPCFALQIPVELKAGEEKEINIFLGTARTEEEILKTLPLLRSEDFVEKSFQTLGEEWDTYLGNFQCEIEDEDTQRMINIWNPYQAQRNFLFSRNLSFYATGTFRGVGYRDTAQDILAMVPFSIEEAKQKTKLLLTQQYTDGHVNHYFFPLEGYEPVTSIHSDDHLWTILTVWTIVMEEGSLTFLNETVPYFDGGEDTVYEHLKRAIRFTKTQLGEKGFPLMLRSDWNDALFRVCKEGKGESIWTSMQLGTMLLKLADLAKLMEDHESVKAYEAFYKEQKELINTLAWDGKWYRRAVMDNGEYLGTQNNPEGKIWLNTQTWSILSAMGDKEKSLVAMESVNEFLNTPLGIKKIHPPIVSFPRPNEPLTNYNPGTGENGSVFCHANTWAIIAECMLGHGDRAYEYYHKLIPSIAMETAGIWRYKAEPYAYASNIFGPDSLRFGLANVSWLTGTAAWMYIAVTQYILGIQADYKGLVIKPCLPSHWNKINITRKFRDCIYHIKMVKEKNKSGLVVNGETIKGNLIPYDKTRTKARVMVYLPE